MTIIVSGSAKERLIRIFRGEVAIFLAVLALATDEPPLSVASAKTAGVAKICFQNHSLGAKGDCTNAKRLILK